MTISTRDSIRAGSKHGSILGENVEHLQSSVRCSHSKGLSMTKKTTELRLIINKLTLTQQQHESAPNSASKTTNLVNRRPQQADLH